MRRRYRNRPVRIALAGVMAVGAWSFIGVTPSNADVTAVRGEAYGYFASVSVSGGPPETRGPAPQLQLPPSGSPPITGDAFSASVQFGSTVLFSSGLIGVTGQGMVGPGGSVTMSTDIRNINRSGSEVFTAERLQSSCTASETGVSGSTTITNGTLQTSSNQGPGGTPVVVNLPTNPAPNTTFNGALENIGDTFQAIFNEQIINPDGSITVFAYHLRLLGPTFVGDLFVGKSQCGVTATTTTTSSSTTSTSTTSTSTTSTSTTSTSTTSTTTPPTTSCDAQTATIIGTSGNDAIVGTSGPDVIVALGGDDRIRGLGGNDVICGGPGQDEIDGGDGNDRLFGNEGNDRLIGGPGSNALFGEGGSDQCFVTPTSTATGCEQVLAQP